MKIKFEPINKSFPHFYHGGDYNPDQWLKYPHILEEVTNSYEKVIKIYNNI
jgi:beta-galactosidase